MYLECCECSKITKYLYITIVHQMHMYVYNFHQWWLICNCLISIFKIHQFKSRLKKNCLTRSKMMVF